MNIDRFKEMNEKASLYDDLREGLEQAIALTKEENKKNEKHLKGYIFDSLVYRYQLALEQRVETLARQYINSGKYGSKVEAEAFVRQHENKRDLMAFIRILDEAIGEHD